MAKSFFNARLLIKLRLDKGLSPDRLAKLAGLSNGSIIRDMESGDTSNPRPDTVRKLSEFFKKSPEDFWADEPVPFEDLAVKPEKTSETLKENALVLETTGGSGELEALLALHRVSMEKYGQFAAQMGDDAKSVIADSLRETRADVVSYLNRMADSNAKLAGVKVALELFCGLVRDNPELISEFGPRIDSLMDFLTGKTTKLPKVSV